MLRSRFPRRPPPPLAEAHRLEERGDLLGAIDALTALAIERREPAVERRLVDLRHRAFAALDPVTPRPSWPRNFDEPLPSAPGAPPEVDSSDLTGDLVGRGITNHGSLVVRSLVPEATVDELVHGIDRAFEEFDAGAPASASKDDRWFEPFDPPGTNLAPLRNWVGKGRGLWLGDVPPLLVSVIQALGDSGALRAVEGYLGERPAMSLQKTTLRRVPPDERTTTWHQDGAFLSKGVRAVNIWLALTPCGGDAPVPGLDVFPRRFSSVLATGSPIAGADRADRAKEVPHAITDELADELADEGSPCRPSFEAGDALFFDELLPHRTGVSPGMTADRYAIETWLFAPSAFPSDYVPLVC